MRDERGRREGGSGGGRRALRWILGIIGGLAALMLVAYAAAAVLVGLLVDPETLSAWAEPRAEAALNRDVEIEGVRLRIFPSLGAELRGVEVASPPGLDGPPLAQVEAIRLDVALLPLFRRRVRVDEVRIDAPRAFLVEAPDGRTNYGDLIPESREPEPEGDRPVELAIRDVSVRNGHLTRLRLADSARTDVGGIRVTASLSRQPDVGWSGSVEAAADSVRVEPAAEGGDPLRLAGPGSRARFTAGESFEWIRIEDGTVRLGEAELALEGRVDALQEEVRTVDLALTADALDLEGLVAMVPESSRQGMPDVGGTAAVDLRVRGSIGPDERPEVNGTVDLASVFVTGPEGERLAEDVAGRIDLSLDEVVARTIEGRALDGPFTVEGSFVPDSTATFQLRIVAEPRLEPAAGVARLPEGAGLAGRLSIDVEASGSARRPEDARVNGTMELAELRATHPELAVPVVIDAATIELRGDRAEWRDLVVRLGEDEVRTSGTLERPLAFLSPPSEAVPRVDAEVLAGRLDLDRVFPEREDPSITYGRIAFAQLGERPLEGRSAEEWAERRELSLPDSLPAAGEVAIWVDTLLSDPYRLTDVEARVVFVPALVEVPDASFGIFGGRGTASVRMGVGGAPEPFTLGLSVEAAEAEDFLTATSPLGEYVTGLLTLDLDVAGELDRRMLPMASGLGGGGRFLVEDGGLEENPLTGALADALSVPGLAAPSFRSWSAPFRLEGATVRFDDAAFETELGPLRYGGAVGLGGGLDLAVRVDVPAERLDSLALGRSGFLSAIAGRLGGDDAPVAIGLGIEGTLRDPRVRPRASLATEDVRRGLQEEAEERAGELRDTATQRLEAEQERLEERAREELERRARDLIPGLGRPDAAADTAAADTGRAPDEE